MFQNLTGKQFGNLTVKEVDSVILGGNCWVCVSKCGSVITASTNNLVSKNTTSCGCDSGKLEDIKEVVESTCVDIDPIYKNPITPEQIAWAEMIDRCYNKDNKKYACYGRKGATVCDRWLSSFENFYKDMGPIPNPRFIIGRGHLLKVYEPRNCKWIPDSKNPESKRNTARYEYRGQMLTIDELAKTSEAKTNKLRDHALYTRIVKLGWSVEKSLNSKIKEAPRKSFHTVTYNGVTKSISEWAKEYGIPYNTLHNRVVSLGWDFEKAINKSKMSGKEGVRTYTHNGVTKTISQWAKELGIEYQKLYNRLIGQKWSFESAVST